MLLGLVVEERRASRGARRTSRSSTSPASGMDRRPAPATRSCSARLVGDVLAEPLLAGARQPDHGRLAQEPARDLLLEPFERVAVDDRGEGRGRRRRGSRVLLSEGCVGGGDLPGEARVVDDQVAVDATRLAVRVLVEVGEHERGHRLAADARRAPPRRPPPRSAARRRGSRSAAARRGARCRRAPSAHPRSARSRPDRRRGPTPAGRRRRRRTAAACRCDSRSRGRRASRAARPWRARRGAT